MRRDIYLVAYHANFVDDPKKLKEMFPPVHPNVYYHHETIEFQPVSGENIKVGTKRLLKVVGRLTTDRVDCLEVIDPRSKNKHPHITLSTANRVFPMACNSELENKREGFVPIEGLEIEVTEGVYNDGMVITKLT